MNFWEKSNKDYDPELSYFERPRFYLENYQYLIETIYKSGILNKRYKGRMKCVRISELGKSLSS